MHRDSLYLSDKILKKTLLPLIPSSIKPNHLTIIRFFLIPLVIWFIITNKTTWGIFIFLLAALTDTLDGALARTRNQITNWGKLYDPLADKLLIGSVAFLLISKLLNFYLAVSIIILEALLIANGLYHKWKGKIIQANHWGKAKMVLQVIGSILLFLYLLFPLSLFLSISWVVLIGALFLGTISLLTYSI